MSSEAALLTTFGAFTVGGVAALIWPSGPGARRLSLSCALLGCLAALALGLEVLQSGVPWTWQSAAMLQGLGGLALRLDPLAAFFIIIIAITGVPASLYGLGYLRDLDGRPRGRVLHALLNVFLAGMCLVPLADNVATFLFAWEVMAVASYLLIVANHEQEGATAAGLWYFVMTHAGFLALVAAFVMLGQGGPLDFDVMRATAGALPPNVEAAVIILTLAAFGVIRVLFDLMPPLSLWWGGAVLALGVVTALTGVLYSVAETHLKRVLAYSTIENIGLIFVALGFALLMRGYGHGALAAMGLVVALLHTLNHAVFKSLLFLAAGAVMHSTHASSLEALGGLIKRMPQTAALCLVGVLALAAVPPLNGFTSEWLTFQLLIAGARYTAPALAIVLPLALAAVALVAGLAAVSAVRLFGIAFLALPRTDGARDAHEAPLTMRVAMALPALACIGLGLAPTLALTRLPTVTADLGLPMGQLDTGLALALPLVGSRLSPIAIAALVTATAALAALASRAGRGRHIRRDSAWNCGRIVQSPRTEYTAAAFAEPLKRVFTGFYRPTQEVSVDLHPVSPYFVRAITLRAGLAPWMEQAMYAPIIGAARRISGRAGRLQTGSIHWYLALLPAALLVLLLVARWIR